MEEDFGDFFDRVIWFYFCLDGLWVCCLGIIIVICLEFCLVVLYCFNYFFIIWDGRLFVNRKRKVGFKNNFYGGGGDNGIGLVVC